MIRGMGGLYQRDGKWYYRTRIKGRLHRESLAKFGVTTEAQARAYLREMERAGLQDRLAALDPSTKTFGQFAAEYLDHRSSLNLSPSTKRQDGIALRSLMASLGEKCLLRTIRQRHVDKWAAALKTKGASPHTINSYLRHIRAALNTAHEWGYIQEAPKLKGSKAPKRLPRALRPEEAEAVLSHELKPEHRAIWEFALWTGLRRQELADLRWQDAHLDTERPWARVIGKGDKERIVPLLPAAVAAMGSPRDMGPVFPPVNPSTLTHWFKDAARRAGVDAHLHDLRHTAATWMAARGVSERVIQEIMGHECITTTQIYTRGLARVADLYDAMAKGLGIPKVSHDKN